MNRKVGVSTNTVLQPTTAKEKADRSARHKENRQAGARNKRVANTVYGALTYKCSNPECTNKIRVHEEMGDRKVLCSKCNAGFFTKLVKDDRKNLARPEDMQPKKNRTSKKKRK